MSGHRVARPIRPEPTGRDQIFPKLVLKDSDGYKSVLYQNTAPILVEAVKTQQKESDALRAELIAMKQQNAALRELAARGANLEKQRQM